MAKYHTSLKQRMLWIFSCQSERRYVQHLYFEVTRLVDGTSKRTIPFTFITDYSDRDVPVQGAVYVDNGLTGKRKIPVSPEDVTLCKTIKDLWPVDVSDSFSIDDSFNIFMPIDVPGVYSIKYLCIMYIIKARHPRRTGRQGKPGGTQVILSQEKISEAEQGNGRRN